MKELAPLGPGTPRPLTSNMALMLHFVSYQDESFDFWIDDVALECLGPTCP